MASSASGQDDPNRVLWLATRAGNWVGACIPRAKFPQKPYNKSFIDKVCSVKMTGYWPRPFFASLWTSTSSRFINTQKKNLANIQPSWPHTWLITHTYCTNILTLSWTEISESGYVVLLNNRELKKATTATATVTSPNKRFNEMNNSCARAF